MTSRLRMTPAICVTRGRRVAKLSPIFWVNEQKCLIGYTGVNVDLESVSRNRQPNTTQNEDVYAIRCRPEAADDIISGENVKTIQGYAVLNFEISRIRSFGENHNQPFVFRVGDGRPT